MTVRFHTTGRDPLVVPRTTPWQRERAGGPILPMRQPRRWYQIWRRT
ncbi:hypothetical protein CP98_03175 [Sphingobium yanoikuyae]|uniref:Uncharacterized protein n=1 Tax=Sphingobium yanoikuyae TaxID=13690 RepID=A0A084EIA0_SPHYA|nr:hypothetical protein [Sphingobium yanoikuyae]KEZ17692.1 hypothetical protein CP98_03175 [Sphingobium yanoikuyae]